MDLFHAYMYGRDALDFDDDFKLYKQLLIECVMAMNEIDSPTRYCTLTVNWFLACQCMIGLLTAFTPYSYTVAFTSVMLAWFALALLRFILLVVRVHDTEFTPDMADRLLDCVFSYNEKVNQIENDE